jgi:glutaredoxin 1
MKMQFTVFGRQSCGYCRLAKELLNKKGYDSNWIDIQQEGITKADLEKTVGKPVLTVPQIFHGETHIGGYTELNEYITKLEKTSTQASLEG